MRACDAATVNIPSGPNHNPDPPKAIVDLLFRLLARLPLRALQAIGAAAGRLAFHLAPGMRARLRENLRRAGYDDPSLARRAIAEIGKTLFEMPWVWMRGTDRVVALVRGVEGREHVDAAQARGRGILYLTPHLGAFEVAAHFAAAHAPITVMYRPPRQAVFEPIVRAGRERGRVRLVRADRQGVFALLRALRQREWVGVLPDQVPSRGEGEWADFFGAPAYTMALAPRLEQSTGAAVIVAFCERLPNGEGYRMHLAPYPDAEPGESPTRRLNRALEALIRRCPEQYLWSYNRYKVPANVAPPAAPNPAIGGR